MSGHAKRAVGALIISLALMSLLSGCSENEPNSEPAPHPTETAYVVVDRPGMDDIRQVLESGQIVAHVRPMSFEYYVHQDEPFVSTETDPALNPYAGMPDPTFTPPADPMTRVSVEVVDVLRGSLSKGTTIDIRQYGGVLNGTLILEENVPRLADYVGQDVMLVITHLDDWAPTDFTMTSPNEGLWVMNGKNGNGKLRLASAETVDSADPGKSGKSDQKWSDITVSQLKKVIAEL